MIVRTEMKEVMTVNFNRGLRVILKSMKTQLENKANKVDYLRKDLIKSLLLSLAAIAIVIALYYFWK